MRTWLPLLAASFCLIPSIASAQARIEATIPADARIAVQRLGTDRAVPAEVAMDLMPGDLVSATGDSVFLELGCGPADRRITYLITSPFRVLVDVPTVASCHVNMLSGLTEVDAEAPTETTAGGVTLGSVGTQYAVELRRGEDSFVFECIVYDDTVRVLSWSGMTATGGNKLVWSADRPVALSPNTTSDLRRSAATYALFDIAAAEQKGVSVGDKGSAIEKLQSLHFDVLSDPSDTQKRVELAKEQLRYEVNEKAIQNLDRAEVRSDAELRRYEIDPSTVRGRVDTGRVRAAAVSPDARVAAAATPTTDSDLRLIAAGNVEQAIANIRARVQAGNATSRDYYALARAWARQGDMVAVRSSAGRALVLHSTDNRLSAAELRELGELIARQD